MTALTESSRVSEKRCFLPSDLEKLYESNCTSTLFISNNTNGDELWNNRLLILLFWTLEAYQTAQEGRYSSLQNIPLDNKILEQLVLS